MQRVEIANQHPLDSPPWVENVECPAPRDYLKKFQEKIDQRCGKDPRGYSWVTLEWGMGATEWCDGEVRAKYLWHSVKIPVAFVYRDLTGGGQPLRVLPQNAPDGITPASNPELFIWQRYDIGVPRLFFAELIPPEELHDWERWRFEWNGLTRKDVLGPKPDAFYVPVAGGVVAAHGRYCCRGKGTKKKGTEACMGRFKLPDDDDLERIAWTWENHLKQKRYRAIGAPLTDEERADIARKTSGRIQEEVQKRDAEKKLRFKDYMNVHGWRWFNDNPKKAQHGKFHFLSGHSKSGTPSNNRIILTDAD